MNSKRFFFVMLAGVVLLSVGLVAGTYGANKLLTTQANTLTALKAKSQALSQEQASIAKSKKDLEKYAELDKIARAVVPEDKDQAEAVREIVKIANANGVSLASISFPASTLGNTSTGAATGTGSSVKVSPSTGALSQLTAVKNIPGVYQLQITVQSDSAKPVSYSSFINFLSALEHNRRTAQVSTISIQPNANNHNLLGFNLTLNGYIKP